MEEEGSREGGRGEKDSVCESTVGPEAGLGGGQRQSQKVAVTKDSGEEERTGDMRL